MPNDTVQIGSLVVSKVVLDFLAPLLGTLIGGFITYVTVRTNDNNRWKQQKEDRLQEQRREAIGIALDWIEPLKTALDNLFVYKNSPGLISELAKIKLPRKLSILLPKGIYARCIVLADKIETFGFTRFSSMSAEDAANALASQGDRINTLIQEFLALDDELTKAYETTFK